MQAIHVLYLEDNADHVHLVGDCLQVQFPGTQLESTHTIDDALTCLSGRRYDAVLASDNLQDGSILPRLEEIADAASGMPLIVIAGSGEEKSGANAIKRGATDYLVKSRESLELLPYLIHRLLKKRRGSNDTKMDTAPKSTAVDQLLQEIESVTRRAHKIHEATVTDASVAALREEISQLRQIALQLSNPKKPNITKK